MELLLDFFFPKFCVSCDKFDTWLCRPCFQQIEFYPIPFIPRLEPLHLDKVYVMAKYELVAKKLISTFKYQRVQGLAKLIAQLIYETTYFPWPDVISFVPMHSQKLQARGFNQAQLIAQELGQITNIPVKDLLIKNKHTTAQASISSQQERIERMNDMFELKINQPKINHLLLIDDVITTGTTLNQCAQVLKEAGIKQISGLTIAHGN